MSNERLFEERMSRHWVEVLGNVSSPALKAVWKQMADTFIKQVVSSSTSDANKWRVLQLLTGTGKTQGLALFCAMLSEAESEADHPAVLEYHPGVLIVTRRIQQADELVETINKLAGRKVAIANHTENRPSPETIRGTPVLVITHKAFTDALEASRMEWPGADRWETYTTWNNGPRRLTVIDEAVDIIRTAQLTAHEVDYALRAIPESAWKGLKSEQKALGQLKALLEGIEEEYSLPGKAREEMLWDAEEGSHWDDDLSPHRFKLHEILFDEYMLGKADAVERQSIKMRVERILYQANMILNHWFWYARSQSGHTVNSAYALVPPFKHGAVVLDATASPNLIYGLMDNVEVLPLPATPRRYDNVQLYYSMGNAVGKSSVLKDPQGLAVSVIDSLRNSFIGTANKVLVCCHQALEPHMMAAGFDAGFAQFDAGHWQALDGRNDWQDFDTVAIIGLPFMPQTWAANTFMALQGAQNTEWLRDTESRLFRQYEDVRAELELGHLTVSIVQAINRIHCRRVIDGMGNCPPTRVFILLPRGLAGEVLLEAIRNQMPGINCLPWDFTKAKRKDHPSNHEEALCRFVSSMAQGRLTVAEAKKQLGISPSTWERIAAKLRSPETDLAKRLAESGVHYQSIREGTTTRAYLYKT